MKEKLRLISRAKYILTFMILTGGLVFVSSCEDAEEPDIASKVVGSYIGRGDLDGIDFANAVIEITKVSNTTVKVSPIGHMFVEERIYGLLFNENLNIVTTQANGGPVMSIVLSDTPVLIGITAENGSFTGSKQ